MNKSDGSQQEWLLDETDVARLGRSKDSTVILRDQHSSRRHAEIFRENGKWILRDCESINGTRLNGLRVHGTSVLEDGSEVSIGDCHLFFSLEQSERPTEEVVAAVDVPDSSVEDDTPLPWQADEASQSVIAGLEEDDLKALLGFTDASLRESTSVGVVSLALQTVHRHVRASVTGFLSLEQDDPLPKMVLPSLSKVDIHLSRELTLQVQRAGRTVWMGSGGAARGQSDSMVSFRDALCVPVKGGTTPLGALHVYRSESSFAKRDLRLCEALANSLGQCLHVLRSRRALEADNSRLRVHSAASDAQLIGDSQPVQQLKQQIRRLADGPKIVLICGESGSGKELVALALHRQSPRHEGPLVPVNCAAITATLPDAELFGHVKGAFTGAIADRPGFFQQADMGTLFLDEIGELSEECQAKLLRVLESGTFRPVGARREEKADVRIIAATNRDLKSECLENRFRKDLFFRLGVEIRVPPLRERRDDIPALVEHFLAILIKEYRRSVRMADEALAQLVAYHWPGNIRQLRSVLEHAVAMCDGAVIRAEDLRLSSDSPGVTPDVPSLNLEELERWAIKQALVRTGGTITQAARMLGIHRDTLMSKMKKYEIEKGS